MDGIAVSRVISSCLEMERQIRVHRVPTCLALPSLHGQAQITNGGIVTIVPERLQQAHWRMESSPR